MKKKQKCIYVDNYDGAYLNFFNTPGAINSLYSFINDGWTLLFIKDDKDNKKAIAVFEKQIIEGEL